MHPTPLRLTLRGQILSLDRPRILGILNLTSDSFYAPSRLEGSSRAIVDRAGEMLEMGADILDLGACSTRPGAPSVDPLLEEERIHSATESVLKAFPKALVSVDTFRASVARTAVRAGAAMINDIAGGTLDPDMHPLVVELKIPYILGHLRGRPENMALMTDYQDAPSEVFDFLIQNAERLPKHNVTKITLDPCFGFAKNQTQNYQILKRLHELVAHGLPVLAGLSRKSMVYKPLGLDPATALNGTTVLNTLALTQGAQLLRVHDVAEAKQCIQLWELFNQRNDLA
ncbi:MAG: dihydropteroate synthase [Bacteroidia bacterium]